MEYVKELSIAGIIAATILGTADTGQQEQLSAWLAESEENRKLYQRLLQKETIIAAMRQRPDIDLDKVVGTIQSKIKASNKAKPVPRIRRWVRIAAAACIALVAGLSAFLMLQHETYNDDMLLAAEQPLASKVRILLGNGEEIRADNLKEDIVTADGSISKNGEGLVVSGDDHAPTGVSGQINRIITEAGGEIHFTLSDGTEVRLNAGSELRFPFTFDPGERKVFLSGEACFEVAQNKHSPFTVVTDKMNIRALGTIFNVKAYANEPRIVATLVSGKVLVATGHSETELTPGMAAGLERSTDEVSVCKVDVGLATAWISGYFMFNDESLDMVMKTLARWYDVTFVFDDSFPGQQIFSGCIRKYDPIEETLGRITLAGGPDFKIENGNVYAKYKQ